METTETNTETETAARTRNLFGYDVPVTLANKITGDISASEALIRLHRNKIVVIDNYVGSAMQALFDGSEHWDVKVSGDTGVIIDHEFQTLSAS